MRYPKMMRIQQHFNTTCISNIRDGVQNELIVDDSTPTPADLINIIKNWPQDHIANEGPLYIYLIGQAAEDRFLIMSDQIITASELKGAIESFQNGYTDDKDIYHPGTNRQVVVIIESAASGTFIEELTGPFIFTDNAIYDSHVIQSVHSVQSVDIDRQQFHRAPTLPDGFLLEPQPGIGQTQLGMVPGVFGVNR